MSALPHLEAALGGIAGDTDHTDHIERDDMDAIKKRSFLFVCFILCSDREMGACLFKKIPKA
ncbi:hypothetical protein ABD67_09015 [Bacillus sonorensis]|uniref:Uncharacterized protein n=1 Tax=Bacillus sonorensis L12 TaxID=1274524 RepID=M5P8C1_9BACI|nr:hypothetical protein BSONL12_05193 [Bacillus sonorensis L12]MBG9915053.1 hypothetical protein [Bacillus sonorensis]